MTMLEFIFFTLMALAAAISVVMDALTYYCKQLMSYLGAFVVILLHAILPVIHNVVSTRRR